MTKPTKRYGVQPAEVITGAMGNGAYRSGGPLFIRTGDAFAKEYEPLEYVVDGILPKGTLITVTGPGNIGKTALGMMIAGHKANGLALNGWDVTKGHVLYASAENTVDFRHRYIAMRDNWAGGFAGDHFHVLTSLVQNGLTDNVDAIQAYAEVLGITFGLVVVDTQAAWSPVEEESNNTEQRLYARALRRLCELPGLPATLVLSHPTKNPSNASDCRPRGGVAFENETDGNWTMWKTGELVEVAWTRLRVPSWQPFSIRIETIDTTSVVDIKGRALRSVRAAIASTDEVKAAQASKPTRQTKWQVARDVLLNALADFPEQRPNATRYPPKVTFTKVERFRMALIDAQIIEASPAGDDRAAKRAKAAQWYRLRDDLRERGHLRIAGCLCWCPTAGHGGANAGR